MAQTGRGAALRITSAKCQKRSSHDGDHSMTSSAAASKVGGMGRPSVLAVLILITSSNLLGCWTVREARRYFPDAKYALIFGSASGERHSYRTAT